MTAPHRTHPAYGHALLVHDNDDQLIEGTRAFVDEGLTSGGDVMVLGTRNQVVLLHEALGSCPRLEYGLQDEVYQAPTSTLFAYQRRLAERPEPTVMWVTGTVPLGRDSVEQAAWNRYESAVNEALSHYPFRGQCRYDTRTRPAAVIDAALATHPTVGIGATSHASPYYVDPAAFLAHPLAQVPGQPTVPPCVATTVINLHDLMPTRHLLTACARSRSAVPSATVEDFLLAIHEVSVNGLLHGAPPVHLTLWTDVERLTCLVEDSGQGNLHPMTGYRRPNGWSPMGLWAARQLVDDLFIGSSRSGGCRVLLTAT